MARSIEQSPARSPSMAAPGPWATPLCGGGGGVAGNAPATVAAGRGGAWSMPTAPHAAAATSAAAASPPLTLSQKRRVESNREDALARKRSREAAAAMAEAAPAAPLAHPQIFAEPDDVAFLEELARVEAAHGVCARAAAAPAREAAAPPRSPLAPLQQLGAASPAAAPPAPPAPLAHSAPFAPPAPHVAPAPPRAPPPASAAPTRPPLTPEQRAAAEAPPDAPLLVLAGPGSGKTATMVARVLHLVAGPPGVPPERVAVLTYTTAAAAEFRSRLAPALGKAAAAAVTCATFHSFCLDACRAHAAALGRTPQFVLYGEAQSRKVAAAAGAAGAAAAGAAAAPDARAAKVAAARAAARLARHKAAGATPEALAAAGDAEDAALLRAYEATLAACDALDYSDLIHGALRLLTQPECAAAGDAIRAAHTHLLVDEFQDTSAVQFAMLRALARDGRITAVGDQDQCIYSFSGSCAANVASFLEAYPAAAQVRLAHNFRSSATIVAASAALIACQPGRPPAPAPLAVRPPGSPLRIVECRNTAAEAAFVCDSLLQMPRGPGGKFALSQVAVLYRCVATGSVFQAALRARGIPFNSHGVAFYRRKAVRAAMALLNCAANDADADAAKRAFKALYPGDAADAKRVAAFVERRAAAGEPGAGGAADAPPRPLTLLAAARLIFSAKLSGTLTKPQLAAGRKALATLELASRLAGREPSLSALVTAAISLLPPRLSAALSEGGAGGAGRFGGGGANVPQNEAPDERPLLQVLLDDVAEFLRDSAPAAPPPQQHALPAAADGAPALPPLVPAGCREALKSFLDYISEREREGRAARAAADAGALALTTLHAAKGREWDAVFLVGCHDGGVPLLPANGGAPSAAELAEERRLFYVGLTRARAAATLSYAALRDAGGGPNQPSRFLRELPAACATWQQSVGGGAAARAPPGIAQPAPQPSDAAIMEDAAEAAAPPAPPAWPEGVPPPSDFLQRHFRVEQRPAISALFHSFAKSAAFRQPARLVAKVGFAIAEKGAGSSGGASYREALMTLKGVLATPECAAFAAHVAALEALPADERALAAAARAEQWQKAGGARKMADQPPSDKQLGYLRSLGCPTVPGSKLEATALIDRYKKM